MGHPAVFLDRDGTINAEVDYLSDPDDLRLIGGAGAAIARLNRAGFLCVVITNQSGIARGKFDEERLAEIHGRLNQMLAKEGAHIDHYEFCPHHPELGLDAYRRDCECRKPRAGMYHRAQRVLDIDPARSWAVGDSLRDLQAAAELHIPGLLVRTGKPVPPGAGADFVVLEDLSAAVDHILHETSGH